MRVLVTLLIVFSTTFSAAFSHAGEENWNQFRGPRGDGTSRAKGLPLAFGEGSKEIVWKTEVAGRAWSSPVVWGRQVWVTNGPDVQNPPSATDRNSLVKFDQPLDPPIRLSAVCLDLETGKVLHDILLFEIDQPQYTHPTNSYASCTPWIEEGRIWFHFGSYGTACVDTKTGKKIWERRDIRCHHWRGPGSSPVMHGENLFLTFDGYDQQFVMALDKNTGKTVWRRDRGIDYGSDNGDRKKAYSTPRVITVGKRELLISPFAMATIAYAPETGEPVWTVYHGGMNAAAKPLYGNGLVYISAGSGPNALIAVKPDGQGDVTDRKVVWRQGKLIPKRPSQILVGNRYYMMNDDGIAACLNALTGEIIWKARVGGRYWSSPLYANGYIYFLSQDGEIPIIRAGDQYELVARNELDGFFNASPAVAGNSLILRSATHVYRIENQH